MLCPPRKEIDILGSLYHIDDPFDCNKIFSNLLCEFTGAKYVVLTDSCTHALELVIRAIGSFRHFKIPTQTYLSVPFTLIKLGHSFCFDDIAWENWYYLDKEKQIIDSAAYFQRNMYIPGTFMCLSFQCKKAISVGRGGAILFDDETLYPVLDKMKYDGRSLTCPWADETDIDMVGYHYYMTPEDAARGALLLLDGPKNKSVSYKNYPDLRKFTVFK